MYIWAEFAVFSRIRRDDYVLFSGFAGKKSVSETETLFLSARPDHRRNRRINFSWKEVYG